MYQKILAQILAVLFIIGMFLPLTYAQEKSTSTIRGVVFEEHDDDIIPLQSASILVLPYGISSVSSLSGAFVIEDIPNGPINIHVSYLGKVNLDTLIDLHQDINLDLTLVSNSFRLKEIDVTAKGSTKTEASAIYIGRNAIEHLQANSLSDVMSLIPGGLTANPDLTGNKQINIRNTINSSSNLNAFGTSIVINGSPVSNNANLQSLNPVHSGGSASLSGGASPNGGVDVRNIPLYNVESVEIIGGVPDVKYGDVISGTVIINQMAGKQPLIMEASTNPNVYSFTVSKGLRLGEAKGALNLGAEYSYNTNDPVQSYRFFKRSSFNALYSNAWLDSRLNSHTGLVLHYGEDVRRLNPDDEVTKTRSSGRDLGFTLNTSGDFRPKKSTIFRSLAYAGRIGLTDKDSHYEQQYTAANAAYAMTYQDGTILSNTAGRRLFDVDGKEITRFFPGDEERYAIYLPSTYLGIHDIEGKEFNAFLSASANFFNQLGKTSHSWTIGADFKTDKNFGAGKQFVDSLPPYRNLSYPNSTFRNRAYKDIPALSQLGIYLEDNIVMNFGKHFLRIKAGLRYDRFSGSKQTWSPRINFSGDVLPDRLVLRGAYGLLSKSPSLLYLNPEPAYFDYVNLNEMGSGREDPLFMTTTRVFSTENEGLKIAQNKKMEAGFDLIFGGTILKLTLFQEELRNGYGIGYTTNSFQPVQYDLYERVSPSDLRLELVESHPVLAKFMMPHNNNRLDKWGLEYQLNIARIDAIRTQFSIYGAHIQQESYSSDFFYYDGQSSTGASERTHIGLYAPKMTSSHSKSTVTAIKATHNIPDLGFVVTLTTDITWNESDWVVYGNDSIPVKYISKSDGQLYEFDKTQIEEPEFQSIIRPVSRSMELVESLPALVNFNINVTKEIGDFMRLSFFANNMFRHYPIAQSDRVKSNYYKRNIPFFFGFRVGVKL